MRISDWSSDVCSSDLAAASAGMSLSLRGVARDVRFVTAHSRRGAALDMDWSSLALGGSTLAFYLGREAAGAIRRGLMQAGLPGAMPVLIDFEVSRTGAPRLVAQTALLALATQSTAAPGPTHLPVRTAGTLP